VHDTHTFDHTSPGCHVSSWPLNRRGAHSNSRRVDDPTKAYPGVGCQASASRCCGGVVLCCRGSCYLGGFCCFARTSRSFQSCSTLGS
jgi:hypothetical protein